MENKILLVNWRFKKVESPNSENITPTSYNVEDDSDAKVIFSAFVNNDNNLDEFGQLVKANFNNNEVLILTHTNPPNNISTETLKNLPNYSSEKLKIREFKAGFGKVYYKDGNGIIIDDCKTLSRCLRNAISNNNKIKKECFNYVWNYYWNELELEYQKKKFIDLYLPLHRDIKGLNEVTDKKKTAYLNEVLAEYNESYFEECKNEWKEIKDILAPNNGYEVLGEIFRLSQEEKNIITSFPTVNEKLFKNHQSTSNWHSQFIAIVDLLNNKIAK